jgi:hypothetical protein
MCDPLGDGSLFKAYDEYSPAEAVKLVITVKNRRSVRNTIIMHNFEES